MRDAGVDRIDENAAGPVRVRAMDGRYLVTNIFGDWTWLEPDELKAFVEGSLEEDSELLTRLTSGRFIHGELDIDDAARRLRDRYSFMNHGPDQHILALTGVSINEEGEQVDGVMSVENADRAIDCAFMSTSPHLRFVFGGDAPLENGEVLDRVVEYVESKNRLARKEITLALDSDLRGLDEARFAWLVEHDVQVVVRFDDAVLDTSHPARAWIPRIQEAASDAGHALAKSGVELRAHLTGAPGHAIKLMEAAVELGAKRLDISPHAPLVIAGDQPLDKDAWLAAYGEVLCRLLGLESEGHGLHERFSADLLASVLAGPRPPHSAMRSPAADGIGQLAYHWDGRVFASETGRRIGSTGDDLFAIGELRYHGYHDMMTHSTVRSLIVAGMLSAQPGWSECAYEPFCGISPSDRYAERGSIQGGLQEGTLDQILVGTFDILFRTLREATDATRATFDAWAGVAP